MKHILFLFLVCGTISLFAIDNPVFYRSTFFSGEPRLSKRYLHSPMMNIAGGKTGCAYTCNKQKVPLLDIYGTQNIPLLATGVDTINLTNQYDAALLALRAISTDPCFGTLSWRGQFTAFEINFDAICNFEHGFFVHWYAPLRKISLDHITYKDLSPAQYRSNTEWQNFLKNFDAFLQKHTLFIAPTEHVGIDSLTFFLGITKNYIDTEHLDYIDATAQLGILAPAFKKANYHNVFDIPLGYSHFGFRAWADISWGIFGWLTGGAHADIIAFLPNYRTLGIKTAPHQTGFIRLAQATARVQPYPLITWNLFVKADHILYGLSLLLAYSYTKKFKDHLSLCDSSYNAYIANSDRKLAGWSMNTFTVSAEYDFACRAHNGPRIGFSYNRVINGRNIFKTNTYQGTVAVDYIWEY